MRYSVKLKIFIFLLLTISQYSISLPFAKISSYCVCFTPYQNCTTVVIKAINKAQNSILVQAYSFTSKPILEALIKAKKRGVNVEIVLDKSQKKAVQLLANSGILVFIDYRVAIAHNKVMIFDKEKVLTGSFNFTKAAQMRNAENLLIIQDSRLAKLYANNWYRREALSRRVEK